MTVINNRIRRVWAVASSTAVVAATSVAPVLAGSKNDDGEERGASLSLGHTILIFVVIPLAITLVISALVLAPGWTSAARKSTNDGYLDDPSV